MKIFIKILMLTFLVNQIIVSMDNEIFNQNLSDDEKLIYLETQYHIIINFPNLFLKNYLIKMGYGIDERLTLEKLISITKTKKYIKANEILLKIQRLFLTGK